MFTPAYQRRIVQLVLLTFTSLTLQSAEAASAPVLQKQPALGAGTGTAAAHQPRPAKKTAARKTPPPAALPLVAAQPAAPSKAAHYGRGIEHLGEIVQRAQAKQSKGENADADIKELRARQRELEAQEAGVDAEFSATEQHIQAHHLAPVMLARHRAAVAEFKAGQTGLKQKLKAFADADDAVGRDTNKQKPDNTAAERDRKVRDLGDYLKTAQHPQTRTLTDPNKLPFGAEPPAAKASPTAKAGLPSARTARPPKHTLREYRASLFKTEPIFLAGPIPNGFTLPATSLPATPTAADLAPTEDIVLTPAIRALAASLNNNPVQINNWVRNNIAYLPSYGSIQGADLTLQTRRGNDLDTASLLIAVLRAAGIPARYVYGTIQVPAAQAANWTGTATPEAALQLLGQGGVPSMGITAGGATGAIELEHVWVEAWVDYTPSRGAINKNPDTWVQLDASYKQATETPGLNLQGAVNLNAQGVLDAARQGAVCTADYAQGLNSANLNSAYATYKAQLSAYLNGQGANLTAGGVLGTRNIIPENHPILMGTLPYDTIVEGGKFDAIPDALRWKYAYTLYAGAAERAQNLPSLTWSASLPNLAGKRLTISYTPATAADIAALASYLPQPHADGTPILASEFPATLPAYLINVRAELRVDGQIVALSGTFTLGAQLAATTGLYVPSSAQWDNRDHDTNAGEYQAIVIDGQGIAAAQLDTLKTTLSATNTALGAGQTAALGRDDVTGLLLQQAAMGYFALADANADLYKRASGMADNRMPSVARAIARVEPQYAFGIIAAAGFPGIKLGIDRYAHAAVAKQATTAPNFLPAAYNRQGMERASAWAADALQTLLADARHPGQGDSAVRALNAANAASQPIRLINAANVATVAPQLQIDAAAVTDIQNAAASGKQILAQNGVLAAGGWAGSGYIIEDTQTGAGDYRLTGAANGVEYPTGGASWPALANGTGAGTTWPAGMAWLPFSSPAQSAASVSYVLNNAIAFDSVASAVLTGMDNTRWQNFPAQNDLINGLYLANLNAIAPANACDAVAALIAAGLGSTSGIGNSATAVNHPPVITSNPATNGAAGQAYRYVLTASDPDGDVLAYSIANGPTGMTISTTTGLVTWANPLEGSYNITLRADDGKAYTDQNYILVIGRGALQLGLTLSVTPAVNNSGDAVTLNVVTLGGQGTVTRSLTVDGTAVTLNASGQATLTAGAMGAHPIVATATDAATTLTKTDVYSVRNPADTTPPAVAITAPVQDAAITAPVDITGSASDANLAYYKLVLKPAGAPDSAWAEIGRGYASVTNGKLGSLDPTVLANGLYDLGLIAVDANGQQSTALIGIELYRDLKIGQFSLSFLDLDINASGIPIRVTRTYDTRKKSQPLDFGNGWSVDYQNLQVRKNMTLGLDWNVTNTFAQMQLCLRPGRGHKISITLPTGQLERFTASNATDCATAQIPPVDILFNAQPGTTSTLVAASVPPNLIVQGGQLYDMDALATWNPTDFVLTTEDGYLYNLSEGVGITRITDPYGNTLTYGANGITHSNGQSVAFTRDALNRITQITDPQGKAINYAYDVNGNLISSTNRTGQSSAYQYNRDHGLTAYTDPSGAMLARYTYDAQGRLTAATDAFGRAIQTNHDTANNRDIVTDRLGRTTTYTYDANGDITGITDPTGAVTAYTYDALGNEARITDPLGNLTQKTYDPATGKQLSESDPLGNTTLSAYDPLNKTQLNSSTDANGNVTSYAYFTYAQNITGPLNSTTHLGYDTGGNLTNLSAAGQGSSYGYDAKGNRTSETDAAGNTTTYTFDANGHELTRTWQQTVNGVKTSLTTAKAYDAEGRVIAETDALGGITQTAYNTAGKPTQITDPAGHITAYTYDAQARLIKTTYPDKTADSVAFDAEGNQTATTDRAGRTTQYTYDGKNRLTQTVHPDGTADTTVYDAAGRTVSTRDANGNPVSSQYDAAGRLVTSTDALNHATAYAYDKNGNRTGMTDANGKTTAYTYDALNRLVKTTYPDATTRTTTYLPNGRKASETDQNGNTAQYGYDALGRINQVTLTSNGTTAVTAYTYDETGNKTSQTDAQGRVTKWAYDNGNRVISRTLPNGETESWQYDQIGNRLSHTDFLGKKTSYTNDVNGRTLYVTAPDPSTSSGQAVTGYTYTQSGQIATATDKRGITQYGYDANDRLTVQYNPDGSYLTYAYDANGNVIQRSTPAGTANYGYDTLNRLTAVTGFDGKNTAYQYDANGNRTRTVNSNGTETGYTYDALNRLTGIEHRTSATATAATALLRGYAYTLKPNGQRSQVREYDAGGTTRTRAYTYDALNRLTQDIFADLKTPANSKTTAYVYGNTGNRTTKTETQGATVTTTVYTYDTDDRLTNETRTQGATVTTTTYTWDANGNLAQKVEPAQTTLYAWDSNNRLAEVKRGATAATAASVATYQYDAQGNRVGKTTAAGQTIAYLVDSNQPYAQVAEEKSTANGATSTTDYLYGLERIQQTRAGQGTYYHDDGLGSTRILTDQAGNVTDSYDYDDYGALQTQTGTTKNDFMFAGEQFDAEANLYYNRARYLDTNTGRFTGLDPFAGNPNRPITLNKYAYAGNDPVNGVDPSGLMTLGDESAAMTVAMVVTAIVIADYGMRQMLAPSPNSTGVRRPTLWDDLVITSMLSSEVLAAMARQVALAAAIKLKSSEDHHTIPMYLCGSSSQELSRVTYVQHKMIHAGLAMVGAMIEVAGGMADNTIHLPFGWRRKSTIMTLAESAEGRAAIANVIGSFYQDTGSDAWGEIWGQSIGEVFGREREKFVGLPSTSPCAKD